MLHVYSGLGVSVRIQTSVNGYSDMNASGPGLELVSRDLNTTTSLYGPALRFMAADSDFITTNPKLMAAIAARATDNYNADTRGGAALDFFTSPNDPGVNSASLLRMTIHQDGNVGIGTTSPVATLQVENTMTNTTTGGLGTIRVFNNSTTLGDVASILFQTYETSGSANRRAQISAGRDGSNSAGYFTVATRDSAGNFNENMRINSVGNVGIGTTSPISGEGRSWHLYNDVNDGTVLSNATAVVQSLNRNAYINVTSAAAGTGGIQFRNTTGSNTTGEGGVIYSHGTQKMFFRTVATNQVTIDSSGNVGIGTSSPGEKLEVQGYIRSVSGSDFINIRPDSIYLYRGSAGGSYIDNAKVGSATIFRTSNAADRDTEGMRIIANGNVGIGTTSPSESLDVNGNVNASTFRVSGSTVINSSRRVQPVDGNATNPGYRFASDGNSGLFLPSVGIIGVSTSSNERMRIDASGNIGIGTTNPAYLLSIQSATQYQGFSFSNGTNNVAKIYGTTAGNDSGVLQLANGGTTKVQISAGNGIDSYFTGGNVGIGTTGPLGTLSVDAGSSPSIRLSEGSSATSALSLIDTAGSARITKTTATGASDLGLDANPLDATSSTQIRFFRNTNTSGTKYFRLYKGDGTATIETQFVPGGNSYINASGGNVGIGTSAPGAPLQIFDSTSGSQNMLALNQYGINTARYTTNSNGAVIHLQKGRGDYSAPTIALNGDELGRISFSGWDGDEFAQGARISAFTSGTVANDDIATRLSFYTTPSGLKAPYTRMTIDSSGNVGIGTTNPSQPFEIYANTPVIRLNSSGSAADISGYSGNLFLSTATTSRNITFSGGATEVMRISGTGNVGIGTTSPSVALDIQQSSASATTYPISKTSNTNANIGDGTTTFNYSAVRAEAGNGAVSGDILASYNSGGGFPTGVYLRSRTAYPLIFATNNMERARIDSSGNMGVGTTSPAVVFEVKGGNGGYPAVTGSTSTAISRIGGVPNNNILDVGKADATPWGMWLQATNRNDLSQTYPIILNPNGGSIGIGTTNPQEQLEVGAAAGGRAIFSNGGGASRKALLFMGPGTTYNYSRIQSYDYGGAAALNLILQDTGGNVGIGTTAQTKQNIRCQMFQNEKNRLRFDQCIKFLRSTRI